MGDTSSLDQRPIGVFDSGVGGLSVLRELERLLPNENFVFLADQLYVPYGEKRKNELVNRAYQITDYLIEHHYIKMMVIACNTSTCNAISEIRKKYSLSFVGTVPAIKPASEKTKNKVIAVISTPATSKSSVVDKLIKDFCKGVQVVNIGCRDLEDEVEEGKLQSPTIKILLKKYLKKVIDSNADHLVLGCTHYPFLKKQIQKIVGSRVRLVDGNKAIARQTRHLLKAHFVKNTGKRKGKTIYITTGDARKFAQAGSQLLGKRVRAVKVTI